MREQMINIKTAEIHILKILRLEKMLISLYICIFNMYSTYFVACFAVLYAYLT